MTVVEHYPFPVLAYGDRGSPTVASGAEELERFIQLRPPTVGRYDNVDLRQKHMPNGLYISPDVKGLSEEWLPQLEALLLLPGAQLCAADSHHQVAVADAAISYGGETVTVSVALKPFTTASGGAEYEHNALIESRRKGFDTYKPLALAKNGETTYLITEWRSEVTTLDNEDWSIKPNDPRYEVEVVPNLTFIAHSLATMHARGVFHEDAQPKNIARLDTGEILLIDLENATIANNENEHEVLLGGGRDVDSSKALLDVGHCWYAMIHPISGKRDDVVFLDGESAEVCMEEFEHQILNPYFDKLKELCPPKVLAGIDLAELKKAMLNRVMTTT